MWDGLYSLLADAFDTEQLLECMGQLKRAQPVNVPIYDFKKHRRCSDSFRKVAVTHKLVSMKSCQSFVILSSCHWPLNDLVEHFFPFFCMSVIRWLFHTMNYKPNSNQTAFACFLEHLQLYFWSSLSAPEGQSTVRQRNWRFGFLLLSYSVFFCYSYRYWCRATHFF
jgi:hypothetical protein